MIFNEKELKDFFSHLTIDSFSAEFLQTDSRNILAEYSVFFENNTISLIDAQDINGCGVKYLFYYLPKKKKIQAEAARPSKWVYIKNIKNSLKIASAEEYINDLALDWRTETIGGITFKFNSGLKKTMDSFHCENVISEFQEIRKYTGINKTPEKIYVFDDYKCLQESGFIKPDILKNSIITFCPNDPELFVKFNIQNCGLPEFYMDGIAGYYNNYISKFPFNNFKFEKTDIKVYIKNLKKLRCSFNPRKAADNENYFMQKYLLLFNLTISKVKISSEDYWKVFPVSFVKFLAEKFGVDKINKFINNKETELKKRLHIIFGSRSFFLFWQWRRYLKN